MSIKDEMTFDQWFYAFKAECIELKYFGPIDKYSFKENYEAEETPVDAAFEFVEDMNSIS